MTIERLSELYIKGYYSKANVYLVLLSLLSQTEDPDGLLGTIPGPLIDVVVDMAERHFESATENRESKEAELPGKILRWHKRGDDDRGRKYGIQDGTSLSVRRPASETSDE